MRTAHHFHLHNDDIHAAVDNDPLTMTIQVGERHGVVAEHDFVFYAESLHQILDLGYEIVNACRRLQPKVLEDTRGEPDLVVHP